MTKRAVNQFSVEWIGMVDLDVTGSAPVMGDANGSCMHPECASRVPIHFTANWFTA